MQEKPPDKQGKRSMSAARKVLLFLVLLLVLKVSYDELQPWRMTQRQFKELQLGQLRDQARSLQEKIAGSAGNSGITSGRDTPMNQQEFFQHLPEIESWLQEQYQGDQKAAAGKLAEIRRKLSADMLSLVALEDRILKVEVRPIAPTYIKVPQENGARTDRCTTCHLGIEDPLFAGAEKLVFRTHPDYENIFKRHPAEKFGCTVCHGGQGSELSPDHKSILKGEMVQASCVRCHQGHRFMPSPRS